MTPRERRTLLALQRCRSRHAPDSRVSVFDVHPREEDGTLTVAGVVSNEFLKDRIVERTADAADEHDVRVLAGKRTRHTVSESVVPVRAEPSADAEQVTQCLYAADVVAFDERDGWTRVRVPDGYVGWVDRRRLRAAERIRTDGVLRRDVVVSDDSPRLFAGTECRVRAERDEKLAVEFRTGERLRVPRDAVNQQSEPPTGSAVVETARQFFGVPYDWGGMTSEGIDCSGLVWVAYRVHGVSLPRDADQQRRVGESVERTSLRPGDLLFFPGHVAISVGGNEYLHAHGESGGVLVSSFEERDDSYVPDLDEGFELARRVC